MICRSPPPVGKKLKVTTKVTLTSHQLGLASIVFEMFVVPSTALQTTLTTRVLSLETLERFIQHVDFIWKYFFQI